MGLAIFAIDARETKNNKKYSIVNPVINHKCPPSGISANHESASKFRTVCFIETPPKNSAVQPQMHADTTRKAGYSRLSRLNTKLFPNPTHPCRRHPNPNASPDMAKKKQFAIAPSEEPKTGVTL
jgi:hypothetical protein